MLPVAKDLFLFAIIGSIGLLYAIGFLLREERGKLSVESAKVKKFALRLTLIWVLLVIANSIIELANILGGTISDALNLNAWWSFLTTTSVGRDYIFQYLMGILAIWLIARSKKVGAIYFALGVTMLALLIPIFQSHPASAGNHGLAIGSLFFHVAALSLWVGGVVGLLVISEEARKDSISRFSKLALWAAITVGVSGGVNAYARLNFLAGWQSRYGFLVILKTILFTVLVLFGYMQRRTFSKGGLAKSSHLRLLLSEGLVIGVTLALGGWLSTTSAPQSAAGIRLAADPVVGITGISMPKAPSLNRILLEYVPDATILGFLLLITSLYILGVVVLKRRGDEWPVGRTIAFAISVALVDFATSGGIGVYAHFAFSYHMLGHMILGMIAPIGFVLSAPITLALRTLPQGRTPEERGLRGTLITVIHSRYSIIMTNPVVALALFDGSLFALYMTPLFGKLMQSHAGHVLMDFHFLLAGYLFFYVIVGIDPNPRKIPHIVRIIVLFAAMSIHAFFSIALLSTTTLLDGGYFASLHRPWNTNLLADQHLGGSIGWLLGEIPILLALIATFIQWMRDDSREARRIDRAADRAAAMGEEDELAKYNKYLATLAKGDLDHPD